MKRPSQHHHKFKRCAIASAMMSVLTPAAGVWAQDDAPSNFALEEVLVTAQRRSESIQDTALAIEAISGEKLNQEGITNAIELTRLTPGLQIGLAGAQMQVYVRGVGTNSTTAVGAPAVALNKNGLYLSRNQHANPSFFDLERIEVLKGPQGTLYGRNATAGAVNILTKGPDLEEFGGYASVDVGNYSKRAFEGAVNIPISDTLAARASAHVVNRDGYLSDGTMADEHWALRLQTLWEPTDSISWRLEGQYSQADSQFGGFTYFGAADPWTSTFSPDANERLRAPDLPIFPFFAPPGTPGAPPGGVDFRYLIGQVEVVPDAALPPGAPSGSFFYGLDQWEDDSFGDLTLWDISSTFVVNMEWATLTWLLSYQDMDYRQKTYAGLDFAILNPITGEGETSGAPQTEIRLSNETDKIKWVVGVNYFEEEQYSPNYLNQGPIQHYLLELSQDKDSFGAFGQMTYSFSDTFRGLAGLRYSEDNLTRDFERFAVAPNITCDTRPGNNPTLQTINGVTFCQESPFKSESVSFNSTDWKLSLEYDITYNSMLFFSVSTGYKAGGYSTIDIAAYEPEELLAYEFGSRNIFIDGRLQFNTDIFFWDYKNRQESFVGADRVGLIGQGVVNGGRSEVYGASVDTQFALTENDLIRFAAEYLHGEYTEFTTNQAESFALGTCPYSPTGNTVLGPFGPEPEVAIDCSGFETPRSPTWSGTTSYIHTFAFDSGSDLDLNLNVAYSGANWTSASYLEQQRAPSLTTYNASLAFNSAEGDYTVVAYVNNITEDATVSSGVANPFGADIIAFTPTPPRTYGVRVRYNF